MNKRTIYSAIVLVVVIMASYSIWSYVNYLDYLNKTIHETGRWAVIMDSKADVMAIETTSNEVWNQLVDLRNKEEENGLEALWRI